MFGFLKRNREGDKFMDRLAAEIHVDPQIYKTALTEMGMNFVAFRRIFEAEEAHTLSEEERIAKFAQMSLEVAFEGGKRLKQKFPSEVSIDEFIAALGRYAERTSQGHNQERTAQELSVGEAKGDYIGCYLLWFVQKGENDRSYQSLANSLEGLKRDYSEFFSRIIEFNQKALAELPERRLSSETHKTSDGGFSIPTTDLIRNGYERDLRVASNCLENPDWIGRHLNGSRENPFIKIGGMEIWLDTGVRRRQKIGGDYVE